MFIPQAKVKQTRRRQKRERISHAFPLTHTPTLQSESVSCQKKRTCVTVCHRFNFLTDAHRARIPSSQFYSLIFARIEFPLPLRNLTFHWPNTSNSNFYKGYVRIITSLESNFRVGFLLFSLLLVQSLREIAGFSYRASLMSAVRSSSSWASGSS